MIKRGLIGVGIVCAMSGMCAAQVLFESANTAASSPPPASSPDDADSGAVAAQASVEVSGPPRPPQISEVSLIAVEPPEPPSFQQNDLITIIISERSQTDREQKFDSKKTYEFGGEISQWLDMLSLLQLTVESSNDDDDPIAEWALAFGDRFKGDASYERDDSVTARVTARVVEVKPNGTLLLEARSTVRTDTDETSIVLSGMCRTEDVTDANTVQSNQMFDLNLNIQNPGDTRSGAQKGWIPKVLEAIFNF